jgi:hypothetical protein
MKNSVEVMVFSDDVTEHQILVDWFAEHALPLIVKQEHETVKIVLKNLTDTPAIYLS